MTIVFKKIKSGGVSFDLGFCFVCFVLFYAGSHYVAMAGLKQVDQLSLELRDLPVSSRVSPHLATFYSFGFFFNSCG